MMTVKECYAQMDGNYEDVLTRIGNDDRIGKYLGKFLKDPNFELLCSTLESQKYEESFICVHNLKGVCCNLGITKLAESSSLLCEELRGGNPTENLPFLLNEVKKDYEKTTAAIRSLSAVKP